MAGLHKWPVYALSIVCHMLERAAQVIVDDLRVSRFYVLIRPRPHGELHAHDKLACFLVTATLSYICVLSELLTPQPKDY